MTHQELKRLAYVLKQMQNRGLRVDMQAFASLLKKYEGLPARREAWKKTRGFDPLGRKILGLEKSNQLMLGRLGTPDAMETIAFRKEYTVYQDITILSKIISQDGVLNYNFVVAKTGRLYVSDALLTLCKECRSIIIPRESEFFYGHDYKNQELRVIALMTKCPELIYELTNGDVHQRTASIKNHPREKGKTINYAYMYGMEPEALKQIYGLSDENVTEIESYLPLKKLQEVAESRIDGDMVEAYFGTWLRFEEGKELRSYMIQGTGAEILKRGVLKLDDLGILPTMLIHDYFLLEKTSDEIVQALEFEIDGIQFPIEVKVGHTWADVT